MKDCAMCHDVFTYVPVCIGTLVNFVFKSLPFDTHSAIIQSTVG